MSHSNAYAKMLEEFMLRIVCNHSSKIHQEIKEKHKSEEYVNPKMSHSAMLHQYLKQFKDSMTNIQYINELIKICDPKSCHPMETIYRLVATDIFDTIDARVREKHSSNVNLQIQFFPTFVQSVLRYLYDQIAMSQPLYFHRLHLEQQRDRVQCAIQYVLPTMVHLVNDPQIDQVVPSNQIVTPGKGIVSVSKAAIPTPSRAAIATPSRAAIPTPSRAAIPTPSKAAIPTPSKTAIPTPAKTVPVTSKTAIPTPAKTAPVTSKPVTTVATEPMDENMDNENMDDENMDNEMDDEIDNENVDNENEKVNELTPVRPISSTIRIQLEPTKSDSVPVIASAKKPVDNESKYKDKVSLPQPILSSQFREKMAQNKPITTPMKSQSQAVQSIQSITRRKHQDTAKSVTK